MMIQPLVPSHPEPAGDSRTSTGGLSANEMFARALADSIRTARRSDAEASPPRIAGEGAWARSERAGDHIDPRSEVAAARSEHGDRHDPTRPSVDRPGHADGHRADDRRADDRGHDRTGRVTLARPGDSGAERPGAQQVDPAGNPVRPDTPRSDNGRRVTFSDAPDGVDPSGELDGRDSPLATALASLMGVDAEDAAAFLQTLMAGLTRSQGAESAEELMARLAVLADRLGGGDTTNGAGGADTELVAAVMDAAVEAGLVEPRAPDADPDADTDPTALLAALTSAIAGGGTTKAEGNAAADSDEPAATMDGAGTGNGIDVAGVGTADGTGESSTGGAGSSAAGDAPAVVDTTGAPGAGAGNSTVAAAPSDGGGDATVSDATVENGAGNGAGHPAADPSTEAAAADSTEATTDGGDNAATEGSAPPATAVRAGDTGTAVAAPTPSVVGGPAGVTAAGSVAAPARPATAAPPPAHGLVELADNGLAEQLRPAFAAVRRGIDGLEELRLRLRNEGGAPIRVDISTVDSEVRVVLSGTNDDVMQRLGQERERLADELRRAGFTSTSIDVRSEGGDDHRRPGTRASLDSTAGRSYDTGGASEEAVAGAVAGTDRSTTTGLDLDL